ncbi:T9SS type B sorting domain-containing protein [Seonamhaeicola sp. ML3]|uniref:T9SS type B sorting domain-containing protein n=1 Tax=Seonamhaeicola sp. ML3 TaxID=2937786 RepID=UPI0020106C76|nr:T9SS type B sorting domain-containing protein [Seonamhaeicola sp. ML3]
MNKTTYVRFSICLVLFLVGLQMFSQNYVPFTPRFDQDLKGDIVLIGNNILGPDNNAFNNNSVYNHNVDMRYIDIDSDPTTFSSSSADLVIPNPGCYRIVHAGLYWGAVTNGPEPITDVKFSGPLGGYTDITGTVIFEANGSSVDGGDSFSYACYADVTSIVTSFATDLGTYTIANVSSAQGQTSTFSPFNGTGYSAGWSLFIVYEDPTVPGKSITSFDGFSAISVPGANPNLDIPVSGFRTVPAPAPVRANFAFATLEGDKPILGDRLLLNGTRLSAADRLETNFFNSSVTQLSALPVNNRNPNSTNTLGFDTGVMVVPNPGNTIIANDDTSAVVRLETSGDTFFPYFFALAVDIIEPNIVLTKIVEDISGNNIGGQVVNLGDELNYVIGFQNTGNDNATDFTIRDILPTNIVFNYPADIVSLPAGVTVDSYNPVTREIVFRIDDSVVEEFDPVLEIRFRVTVVANCSLLDDACSNIINNQAYATYNGTLNPSFTISDDPSINSNTGCLLTPGATNFLSDLNCQFREDVILCGDNVELRAGDGYDAYTWSSSPTGTPVIGTGQTLTVNAIGTYYVHNEAIAPCQSIDQIFDVITYGAGVPNPVIPFADQVVVCPNDGKELPNFFLCGANDSRYIQTGITDTSSMIWERLDESSCAAVLNQDCANEDAACTWNQVATGPDYLIEGAGQYRLTLNYTGGCFNQYYFNVYENVLVPTVSSRDIICTTPGEIVIGGVPSGYEYSIDGVNYQVSNTFSVTTAGIYTAFIRQIGVSPNPCIFQVPDIQIRERDFTVSTTINQPLCFGELGSVVLAANDVRPQYFFSIYQGGTLVNSVGPITSNNYTFSNLNPGTYTVNISTEDGCTYSGDIDIIEPPLLTATAAITQPLTCTNGEITVYPNGGTPPYFYFVNSTTSFQTVPTIDVSTAGTYNITVVDSNNCSTDVSIDIDAVNQPDFNISTTDISCAEDPNSGGITINVLNANGNTLRYSIDNGVTYSNSPVFNGLTAGSYDVVVEYTFDSDVCETVPQNITITSATAIDGTATLTTPFTCNTNGVITVSGVTGGTTPYTYSIDGINYQLGNVFSGLTDGTYTISIRDASSCTFITAPVVIDPLNPPTDLDFSHTTLSCPANTTTVTVNATGGTVPLEYQIIAPAGSITPYQSGNSFSGLSPGTYTFQVRDANNCKYAETYTVTPLPPVTVDMVLTKDLDCTASPDAIITGSVAGGTAPYSYSVSYNSGGYGASTSITGTTFTYTTPNDGTYEFEVTDSRGCTVQSGVIIVAAISLPEITSVVQTQDILCHGDNNAAIDVTINNTVGTPPFTINVNNDTTATNYGTQTSGLTAGTYTITLTDAKSCTDTETIVISEPSPINVTHSSVDITCGAGGVSFGSVIIDNVTGGTAPYNYFVTGTNGYSNSELNTTGTTSVSFNVVDFGLYQINVVDSNGCSVLIQDVLVASPPDDLDININTTVDCTTGGTAVVNIGTSLVSTGPFYFDIYTGVIPPPPPGGTWVAEDAPGSQSATFTGLTPGLTYTFIVYDTATNCSYYETASASVPTNSTLTTSALTSNNITCVGSADGNVSFTVNSIYASSVDITYEIFNSLSLISTGVSGTGTIPAGASISVSNLGPLPFGTYYVSITETSGPNAGCGVITIPFNITESARDLNISASIDRNANCNPNSGLISAVAQDGTAPYVFQITTSSSAPAITDPSWNSSNTFNVNANTYYVHVKDAYNCVRTTSAIVLPADPEPVVAATLTNQCTVTEGNFEVDVTLTAIGIAPYSYSIDGGAYQTRTAPFTLTNLSSGVHTIEVQDANGCGNMVSVNIAPPVDIVPTLTVLPTCNNNDGEITVTGNGGSGTYNYSISPNPVSISLTSNVFSGVPSGTYTVTITDAVTTCSADATIIVPEANPLTFTTTTTPVTCFGDNNGSISININGYSGPYTYEVFDSSSASVFGLVAANTSTNPHIISGLSADNYTITVIETASPFCSTSSGTISVGGPPSALTLVASETSNVTCDNDKGTITAVASGGWGDYQYELTGTSTIAYSNNATFTDLSAGAYIVNVRDAGGCVASYNITLDLPTPINATIAASPSTLACFDDDNATITVTSISGGQGNNYSYVLNMVAPTVSSSGPQTSNIFTNLSAGTYNVTVNDGFNCEFTTANIVITEPTQLEASLVKATSQTCTTDATLTLSATGGTGNYEYSNTSSFTAILGTFSSSTSFSVTPGDYMYYVRDANGCVSGVSNQIAIDPLPALTLDLDTSNATINCSGDTTGVIVANAQGGLGSYIYTLQDTLGNPIPATQTTPGVFTDLPVGDYQIRVESGDCLFTSSTVAISEPNLQLQVTFNVSDVSCSGENNGILEILATGGTGILKYAISPQLNQFFDTPIFEDLAPGNYQAIAQDELGCFVLFDFTIDEPLPVMITIVPNSLIPEVCEGDMNGEFSIDISGGTLPYSIALDDPNGTYITGTATQTIFDFTGLSGGDHLVYVRDAEGCESEWNITFPESVLLDPEVRVEYCTDVTDAMSNAVTVTVDESVDVSQLDYSLDGINYQTSNVFIDVPAGLNKTITVRHTNGCQQEVLFDVNQYQPLQIALDDGQGINEIEARASGGSGNYEFAVQRVNETSFEPYQDTGTFIIYESGEYTVTVTDSNGCVATASRFFEFVDVCVTNYFVPANGGWGPGCTSQYRNLTFDIFDRYGRKIATLGVDDKWDGTYNGKELPSGDYWYVVKLNDTTDDRSFVGHFTLYR